MGTEFRAANGLEVRLCENGGVEVGKTGYRDYVPPAATVAVEEFFNARSDVRHGRWRWEQNPHLVMYPVRGRDAVLVLHEAAGESATFTREQAYDRVNLWGRSAARAYFDAHPLSVPVPASAPWADAEAGDVWVFAMKHGGEVVGHAVAGVFGVRFCLASGRLLNLTLVSDARRIYPEDAS